MVSNTAMYWGHVHILNDKLIIAVCVGVLFTMISAHTLEQIVTVCVYRWVSGWTPCLTTWNTSRATSSPVTLMPSWCPPTPQPWTPLTNSCPGRIPVWKVHHWDVKFKCETTTHSPYRLPYCSSVDLSCLCWSCWFSISMCEQFHPEWLQLCPLPGAGFSSDVWCRTLPQPPCSFQEDGGCSLPHQSNHRPEGAVLCLVGCR